MKKIIILTTLVITVIISVITLFFNNNIESSIVFIESLNENYINEGMGIVYKIKDNNNYIITNYHVIDKSEEIYVYNLKKEKIKAEVVNYDKYTDIALLKIEDRLNLKEVNIDTDNYKEKDIIYYFNIDNNDVEKGKILELNTEIFLDTSYGLSYYDGIQIEGNITEGNSGGPVFNRDDEIIGIISLKEEDTNKAIYISIDKIIEIVSKLENHTLERPNLGGVFASVSNESTLNKYNLKSDLSNGVIILELIENYSLDENGFEVGDVIVSINDIEVNDISNFQKIIYYFMVGDIINIKFYRDGAYDYKNLILKNE